MKYIVFRNGKCFTSVDYKNNAIDNLDKNAVLDKSNNTTAQSVHFYIM